MFQRGDKVRCKNPELQSYGEVGTILYNPMNSSTCYIRFINWCNTGETKELTIHKNNLELYIEPKNKEEIIMDNRSVTGVYRVAGVKFISGVNMVKEYMFALFDHNVDIGDLVLCDTQNGYCIARVSSITDQGLYDGVPVTKEIVCKVDFTAFEKRKERRKQKGELKRLMDRIVAENQELILYQAIADKNPDMAALLASYKEIGDV